MINSQIISQIKSGHWAITKEAFKAIISITQRDLSNVPREFFHAAGEPAKDQMIGGVGTPVQGLKDTFISGDVGMFFIDGPIIPRADLFSEISGMTSIETLTRNFKALEANSQVKKIVMLIDSPGGFITGVSEFANLISESEKETVAFGYGMIASAAYWIASAADKIVVVDTGMAGSIGVIVTFLDDSKRMEMEGLEEIDIISSQSPNKRVDPQTDEGHKIIQNHVDEMADIFITTVATNRNTSKETVLADFGQGEVLIGKSAVKSGLVDGISTLDNLLFQLKENGSIHDTLNLKETTPNLEGTMSKPATKPAATEATEKTTPEATAPEATTPEATAPAVEAPKVSAEDAATAERERIQGCESLMGSIGATASAAAKIAARKTIDENKFTAGMTKDSLAVKVLEAVSAADSDTSNATAEGARELATEASAVPGGDPADSGSTADSQETDTAAIEKETSESLATEMNKIPRR